MNLTELQITWNSSHNQPPGAQQQLLMRDFARRMVRRRRFQSIWLANTFVWLAVITIMVVRAVILGRTNLANEWGVIPLVLAPWAITVYFIIQFFRSPASTSRGGEPLFDSLRGELEANRIARSQWKWVGALYLITIPLLVLAMTQLQETGKISPHERISMDVFFGVVMSASVAGAIWRYFWRLSPQRNRLEELIRYCDQG